MATSTKAPTNAYDDSAVGAVPWTNPTNTETDDATYSVATILGLRTDTTHYLHVNTFGFSIPSGSEIKGIVVDIQHKSSVDNPTNYCVDNIVKVVKADGSLSVTNNASATHWGTIESAVTYGGTSSLWGEAWTAEDINDPDFGVVLSTSITAAFMTLVVASVDYISITVTYLEPPTDIGVSDSGSGTENTSISNTFTIAQTGDGTETLGINATIPIDDNGVGSSNVEVTASITLNDVLAGVDTIEIASALTIPDDGTATENIQISVISDVNITDSGTATEGIVISVLAGSQHFVILSHPTTLDPTNNNFNELDLELRSCLLMLLLSQNSLEISHKATTVNIVRAYHSLSIAATPNDINLRLEYKSSFSSE